jgi:hypothetical protein
MDAKISLISRKLELLIRTQSQLHGSLSRQKRHKPLTQKRTPGRCYGFISNFSKILNTHHQMILIWSASGTSSRGSSFSIVTKLRAGQSRRGSIPWRAIIPPLECTNQLCDPHSVVSNSYLGPFPWESSYRGVKLTTFFQPVLNWRICGAMPQSPTRFHIAQKQIFISILLLRTLAP